MTEGNGASPQDMGNKSRRVLVAEDDPLFRVYLCRALETMGHRIATVADGAMLAGFAAMFEPDVVLSDIGLPRCDGIQACGLVRLSRPSLRIVLMTGDPQAAEAARRAGFELVLLKPFDLERLRDALSPF